MARMQELASQIQGVGVEWAGLSYQERLSSGQAPLLYALSLLVVFLCLAALYESWSVPVAVLLVVPLGLIGAVLAVTLRGLINDVYLQIGLLTTMGLAAKNAILIVEFAEQAERRGTPVIEAAMEAARLRLRPILMTSLAFIFGVLPLALAHGAGANSRIAIGTAVIGGMLTATILAIFYIPLFFVLVRQGGKGGLARLFGRRRPVVEETAPLALPTPNAWPQGPAYPQSPLEETSALSYRDVIQDPRLLELIALALENNRDLQAAAANVEASRAQYRIQRAALLPSVDASGSVTRSRAVDNGQAAVGGQAGAVQGLRRTYSAGLGSTAYEIDLFGRVRSLTLAAQARYFASEAGRRAVRITLIADLSEAWLLYASDRSLLDLAEQTVASAEASERLTRARLEAGIAPRSDLRQTQTVLASARADVANQQAVLAQDLNALTLIVGAEVGKGLLPSGLSEVSERFAAAPAGLPSQVLLRRPDVLQAEQTLLAANADIGAARVALFPSLSLTSAAGYASLALSSLFTGDAFTWSSGLSASLPLFQGGAGRAGVELAQAQPDALARLGTVDAQLAARREAVLASDDAYRLADARYRGGVENYLSSLDAQRTLYANQQAEVAVELTRALNRIALYRALAADAVEAG
ncbi:hypothetical protein LTR94_025118 [Friedmanniomyces endolithicus]|nr:hypothetical protein LTR94_025118 [Friedmanniomyces endolithicus]